MDNGCYIQFSEDLSDFDPLQTTETQTAQFSKVNKSSKSKAHSNNENNVNYISIGMKRLKELSMPIISLLNSLNPSQRRMAIVAVGIIFFWPILILVLNLPWILATGCVSYAIYFGKSKFYNDANEAVKDHLSVDVEEKGRQVQLKFKESNFPGKEVLIRSVQRLKEISLIAYKSILLASMTLLDYLVTILLNLARSAKNYACKKEGDVATEDNVNANDSYDNKSKDN